jgi:hypothetical protein
METDNAGHYAHVSGLNNTATGNGSNVSGEANNVSGARSFVTGKNNKVSNFLSFVGGEGNKTAASHQTIFGKYNEPNANALFILGAGTGDNDRKNALMIDKDSHIIGPEYFSLKTANNEGYIDIKPSDKAYISVGWMSAESSNINIYSGDGAIWLKSHGDGYAYSYGDSYVRCDGGYIALEASSEDERYSAMIELSDNMLSLKSKGSYLDDEFREINGESAMALKCNELTIDVPKYRLNNIIFTEADLQKLRTLLDQE